MKNQKIIAILGLPGSGKTEAIEYLEKKFGWPKVYFGEVTFDEIKKRGLEINEKNEKEVREGLRVQFGQLIYAHRTIEKIENLPDNENVLVESLYSWPEYLEFKKKFGGDFLTIAVYASSKIRYERMSRRPVRPLTPDDCQGRDYAQIENLSQAGPIAMADYILINETTMDDLYSQIDKIISKAKLK